MPAGAEDGASRWYRCAECGRVIDRETMEVVGRRRDMSLMEQRRRERKPAEILTYLRRFKGFIGFHGCRPIDVRPYYAKGIKLADHEELTAIARRIFVSPEFPEIRSEEFDLITSKISGIDHAKTYVVLDEQELIGYCGHYLIYGSEHICGIAASLTRRGGRDYRQVLKRFGIPTVFRLAIPYESIPKLQLEQLADHLSEWCEEFIGWDDPPHFSWSFILDALLPPEFVVAHCHPDIVPDPLLRHFPYRYRDDGTVHDISRYL